jgi:hypothetical protein
MGRNLWFDSGPHSRTMNSGMHAPIYRRAEPTLAQRLGCSDVVALARAAATKRRGRARPNARARPARATLTQGPHAAHLT